MRTAAFRVCVLAASLSSCLDFARYSEIEGATSGGAQTPAGGEAALGNGAAQAGGAQSGGAESQGGASASGAGGVGGAPEALPRHCLDIIDADPRAEDGEYEIDPDGEGAVPSFKVRCDMTIDAGGWTRFNWLTGPYPTGSDPLALSLDACNNGAPACPGRIPPLVAPTDLLVKDLKDGEHAVWKFDGSVVSNAMIGALRDKAVTCVSGTAFDPFLDTSGESFCNTQGGCDNFKYTDSGCNGTNAWVLTLDDDSHYCRAAFKLGAATGSGNCGAVDWGFLDDCDCNDEGGELYFR